jgi:four helix bundle protein
MNQELGKIKSFTDLFAWQEAHKLVLLIYKITKTFPKEEVFGLIMQMRRCSVSITSNIAEGFSRQSYREKVQFYSVALGSHTELQNQLLISRDVKIISPEQFDELFTVALKVHKILSGLIKSSNSYS